MSSFYGQPQRVSIGQQRRLAGLAEAVCRAIVRAGLPTTMVAEDHEVTGANGFVDTAADEMGGVFVVWRSSDSPITAAIEALDVGRTDDPVIRHAGSVSMFMCDAVLKILVSAGLTAQVADDDVRIMVVQVAAAPSE